MYTKVNRRVANGLVTHVNVYIFVAQETVSSKALPWVYIPYQLIFMVYFLGDICIAQEVGQEVMKSSNYRVRTSHPSGV